MNNKIKILHLEDIPTDAELVGLELRRLSVAYDKLLVDNKVDYINALNQFKPDIILSDHSLPSFNSLEALKILKSTCLNIPFILITSTISEEFAVEIMKEGATDYILKDRMQRLPNAVNNALDKYKFEAERQKANEELKLLFNTIDEVYFTRDLIIDKLIRISPACEKVYGYTPEEFLADVTLWGQITHPDDKHLYKEHFSQYYKGESAVYQYRVFHKDGSLRWLESKMIPVLGENGELLRLYGVTRNITERKTAEDELQKQHERLLEASETQAAILNALPSGVVLLNAKTKIIAVNQAWKNFTLLNNLGMPNYGVGYNYLAIVDKAIGIDETESIKISQGIKDVVAGIKNEFTLAYFYFSPIGKRWFQIMVAPLADRAQKGAVVLHIDITDKKLAEESLLQSESNLRSIFENTDLSIILFDRSLKVLSYNTNASRLAITHFNRKLKAGNTAFNYFKKERKSLIKEVAHKVSNKETVCYETAYDVNGIPQWYDVKWNGIFNQQNENIGVVLTLKNITEKKNADMERERITAELVRRNMDLEQFTYIISHNLRAPVANIIGLSDLMKEISTQDNEHTKVLNALATSIKSLDDVIGDLNHVLQVNSQVNENAECVDFKSLIQGIKSSINYLIEKENIEIICDFEAALSFHTLKSYMHSILYNLIVNSIKYKRMGVPPVITIIAVAANGYIEIIYKDNGKGIDLQKNSGYLFGLYKRFDYSVEGKGMGLYMIKVQIENLGGTINVQSELNKGTTFIINLPAQVC